MVSHRLSSIQIIFYKYTEDGFTYAVKYTDSIQKMVSHRLSSIQIKSYKTLYRRWFHIGCQVYRYNLIRLYTEDGFT